MRKKSSESNKRTKKRREQRRKKKQNDNLLNLADFFNLAIEKEKPEIFCKDCNNWINKEDLIHFCKNETNLEEEFSGDKIETISLAELEEYKEKVSEDKIEELQLIQTFQN
jgi:hypothetical protein